MYAASNPKGKAYDSLFDVDYLRNCAWIFWQTAAGCPAPEFVPGLPKHVKQVRFPSLFLKWYWPFHYIDESRHVAEPGFPDGRFPYGDRLITRLLAEDNDLTTIAARYLSFDLTRLVNLERFREIALREIRLNDKNSDISAEKLLADTAQCQRAFSALNHPNPVVLQRMVQQIVLITTNRIDQVEPESFAETDEILGHQEIPIHPEIAKFFSLPWVQPSTKWRYGSEDLTIEEYVFAYAQNRPIYFQESPQLWIERAKRAFRLKDFKRSEALLLKAAQNYTQHPDLLVMLSALYSEIGRNLEAEKAARYCLGRFPGFGPAVIQLSVVLIKQGHPKPAEAELAKYLLQNPHDSKAKTVFELARKAVAIAQHNH